MNCGLTQFLRGVTHMWLAFFPEGTTPFFDNVNVVAVRVCVDLRNWLPQLEIPFQWLWLTHSVCNKVLMVWALPIAFVQRSVIGILTLSHTPLNLFPFLRHVCWWKQISLRNCGVHKTPKAMGIIIVKIKFIVIRLFLEIIYSFAVATSVPSLNQF